MMHQKTAAGHDRLWIAAILAGLISPMEAMAYVDPGTTGLLSQILYVLFYSALGVFIYFLRYIKQYLTTARQFLVRLFGGPA
jgi:hypothetical protein